MDNPKIENILVPQAVAEYKQALKNVGVPSSFLEPFADKDFEESVYVRFSEALEASWERAVGEAMTEDTATNLVDDELVQHDVAMALRRTCAAELWERIGTESAIEDVGLDDLCNLAHVRAWFADRDGRIVERAKGYPACWGGNFRVEDNGLYATEEDVHAVLNEPGDLSLYYSCCGCMTYDDWRELAEHRKDEAWLDLRAAAYIDDDPVVYFTEIFPNEFDRDELEDYARERPDLFTVDAVKAWPRDLGGPALSAGIDLNVNGEPTWISFEEGVPGLQSLSELREHFLSDPDLEEDRLAGSTCESWISDLERCGILSKVLSPKAAKSDVLAASSIASALSGGSQGPEKRGVIL